MHKDADIDPLWLIVEAIRWMMQADSSWRSLPVRFGGLVQGTLVLSVMGRDGRWIHVQRALRSNDEILLLPKKLTDPYTRTYTSLCKSRVWYLELEFVFSQKNQEGTNSSHRELDLAEKLVDHQKDLERIELGTLRIKILFALLLTFCVIGFSLVLLLVIAKPFTVSLPKASHVQDRQPVQKEQPVQTEQPGLFSQHFFGGFGINRPAEVVDAASDGVQVDFHYGMPASPNDPLGQALTTNKMKLVDSALWDLLGNSHCYDLAPSSRGPCVDALLSNVKQHLLETKDNALVVGYWILDDYPGDVKTILPQLTSLVHQYAPGKPTICGFGGELYPHGGFSWSEETVSNFSSAGCDVVALYLYPSAEHTNTQCSDFIRPPDVPGPDAYDWSMSGLLSAAFASLEQRGWNPQRTPWIGIAYAFAGCRKDLNNTAYQVMPTVSNMETQALSFCKAGAQGIVWYGWEDSTINVFPNKSPQMKEGVQSGMKACKAYWNHASLTSSIP